MSMYLDDGPRPLGPRNTSPRKRYSGEVLGPYKLIKLAGEGPNAIWNFWKALCLVCGFIDTINVRGSGKILKQKGCKNCRGKKPEAPSISSTEGASSQPTE
jgi:hypothetical protein